MSDLKQEEKRNLISDFYTKNLSKGKPYTVKYFEKLGICRRTVYNVISRVEKGNTLNRKKGSGRKHWKISNYQKASIFRSVDGKSGISQRKMARKYNVSQQYVSKLLKNRGIKYYKRQSAPDSSETQEKKQKTRLRILKKKLNTEHKHDDIVIDDESYFTLNGYDQPNNRGYYASDKSTVDPNIKYKRRKKFAPKILVWIAISNKGISDAYFLPKNGSIDANIYINQCILKRLIPFLNNNYPNGGYWFWPDLASAHYANDTIAVLHQNHIKFVDREINPPNVPQLRPIEKFWAQLKSKVYENNWEAKDIDQLKRKIKKKLTEFNPDSFWRLFESLNLKINTAARHGPDSILK